MSEPAVAVAPPTAQRQAMRLGSFVVGPRVIDARHRLGNVVLVAVTGAQGSPRAGAAGFAYCTALGEPSPGQLELAEAVLGRIASLSGTTLVPVLEAGVAGRIGYVAEATVPGERLSDRLAREQAFAPFQVANIAAAVASALDVAHRQRVSHGMVVPAAIWVGEPGEVKLGGFGLSGRGPARDQEMLAALCLEMLSGSPWNLDPETRFTQPQLVERIRATVHGLTEPLAAVFARGLAADPSERFPTVHEFGTTLRRVVQDSAAEMAAGAWEAISRRDMAMAELLTDMTAGYDPASPEVRLLRVRLNDGVGGAGARLSEAPMQSMESLIMARATVPAPTPHPRPLDTMAPATLLEPAPPVLPGAPTGTAEPVVELAQFQQSAAAGAAGQAPAATTGENPQAYDEAELRRLFAPEPIVIEPPKGNPWVIFLTVVFALVALMSVLAAIMFTRT